MSLINLISLIMKIIYGPCNILINFDLIYGLLKKIFGVISKSKQYKGVLMWVSRRSSTLTCKILKMRTNDEKT